MIPIELEREYSIFCKSLEKSLRKLRVINTQANEDRFKLLISQQVLILLEKSIKQRRL